MECPNIEKAQQFLNESVGEKIESVMVRGDNDNDVVEWVRFVIGGKKYKFSAYNSQIYVYGEKE